MVANSQGQTQLSSFACGFVWIALGGVLAAILSAFTLLGAVGSTIFGQIFSGVSVFMSCV